MRFTYRTNPLTGAVEKTELPPRRWQPRSDYFRGVAPSDLAKLENHQVYELACRLYEELLTGVGTPHERACLSEAYSEVIRERHRRRYSIR